MRIQELFLKAQIERDKLFIPYITAGDPLLSVTEHLVKELTILGADVIELGVPFSDPLADGPTNQKAAQRALKNKVSLKDCCQLLERLRSQGCKVPLVLFTYLNPVMKLGIYAFAALAVKSGVDAVLLVDLPIEEGEEVIKVLQKAGLGVVLLITPTTSLERIQKTAELNPEFLYYVSRTGVTGVQNQLSSTLAQELERVRAVTTVPVAIGFGISTPEHVKAAAQLAEGVIVGSSLVKELEEPDFSRGQKNLLEVARRLIEGLEREKRC